MDNLQALSLLKLIDNWGSADLKLIEETIKNKLRTQQIVAITCYDQKIPFFDDEISKENVSHLINFIIDFVQFPEHSLARRQQYINNFEILIDFLFKYNQTVTQINSLNILLDVINSDITNQELRTGILRLTAIFNGTFTHPFDYKMRQLILNFLFTHSGKNYEKYFILVECHRYDYIAIYSSGVHTAYLEHIICSDINDLPRLKNEKSIDGQLIHIYQVK